MPLPKRSQHFAMCRVGEKRMKRRGEWGDTAHLRVGTQASCEVLYEANMS